MNPYQNRRSIVATAIVIVFAVIAFRLFQVQILNKEYRVTAENNALKYETIYPARGRILDRNGEVIVDNKLSYDIMVTPYDVQEFDTLAFCKIFDIDTAFVKEKFREYRLYRRKIGYQTLVFKRQVTGEQYNMFVEKSFLFPGFAGVPRTTRTYPFNAGGNLLGYTSEVSPEFLADHPEYKAGDYYGRTGLEAAREQDLRALRNEEQRSDRVVADLQRDKNRYQKELETKRRQVEALNREIERIIAQAIEDARRKEEEAAKKNRTSVPKNIQNDINGNIDHLHVAHADVAVGVAEKGSNVYHHKIDNHE